MTFVRFSRLADSDLSAATIVTATDYPSLDRHTITAALADGPAVMLVHTAAACLGGDWGYSSISGYRDLLVESATDFLSGHAPDQTLTVQDSGTAYRIASSYPTGWSILGCNTVNSSYRTAFSHTSGGSRGAIFTYDPSTYSDDGDDVAAAIVTWLRE